MNRPFHLALLLTTTALTGCRIHIGGILSDHLPADGRDQVVASFTAPSDPHITGAPASSFHIVPTADHHYELHLRTPVNPGILHLTITANNDRTTFPLTLTPDTTETADGTPDWMRLHTAEDRLAFRRWFTELAERAADAPAAKLPPEITDCASLLRYAYREALRTHDDKWYAQFPPEAMPALASVQQWSYPNTPLGPALFRVRPGSFRTTDLSDGAFAQFADAKTLQTDNATLLGRNVHSARAGDLIFYRVLESDSQYHSMILAGEHGEWVVYHTGPIEGHSGEMRRVLLSDLLRHPDPRWRPEPNNPNFLGVYRWNILKED